MPNRGLVGETMPATVPGMASQAMPAMEADMDEGNAFTAALAKTPKGEKFTVGDKTFTDRSDYSAKIDEFAFEALDKQLDDLLNEGLSVNMSQGLGDSMGGQGSDSVSVTATDDDAAKLLDFIKQVGLGGLGGEKALDGQAEPVAAVSDYGAPKFSGHDDMMGLMKVVSGDDYKDEQGHADSQGEKSHGTCNECGGVMEADHACEEGKEMVDEVESEDQMTYQVAEDDGEGYEQSQAAAAEIDSALASKQDVDVTEGGDGGEASEETDKTTSGSAGEGGVEDPSDEQEKLDEWANDAGKDGTDQAFERDIDFMTKIISGGLNKPKSTGQTTVPVIAGQDARTGDEDVTAWKRLAGLLK